MAYFGTRDENLVETEAKLQEAQADLQNISAGLRAAGAAPVDSADMPSPVPLHLLDTSATRRLLVSLQEAQKVAEAVDRERGWVLSDGTPCGFSETIGEMYERLRQEVEGPKGREEGP